MNTFSWNKKYILNNYLTEKHVKTFIIEAAR